MTDLNAFFPHKICMNLEKRPERWARMQRRFTALGIHGVVRFPAIDGLTIRVPPQWSEPAGAYGCLQTNLEIVRMARKNGWSRVLILEDDVVFHSELNARFARYITQVPADWDMLFFGCMHREEPVTISKNIWRLTGSTATYAYALNHTMYDSFIRANERYDRPVDINNTDIQKRFNCYCFTPHLAWVDGDHSDTYGRAINPWWLKESLVLGGEEMERLQRNAAVVIAHRDRTESRRPTHNLMYVLNHYHRFLNGCAIVLVEQNNNPSVNPDQLPAGCHYRFIQDEGEFSRGRCFNEGVALLNGSKDLLIFTGGDILASWDLKAALRKCAHYDVVSSFHQVLELDRSDTDRILRFQRIDTSAYRPRYRAHVCDEFCIFTREAIERMGGWPETPGKDGTLIQSVRVRQSLNVFESPGWALKLCSEEQGAPEQRKRLHSPPEFSSNANNTGHFLSQMRRR